LYTQILCLLTIYSLAGYKIDKYIKDDRPIYLFLSHYHLDHVIGLHTLNKFHFRQGLDVYGPLGLKMLFKKVINKPYTIPVSGLHMKVRLHEISGRRAMPKGINYAPLKHSVLCYGYRFYSEGRTVAYCTDTGVCDNLFFLANNADLLIAESSYKAGQKDESWPHLNPENVANIAKQSRAKRLVLLHFDAALYLDFRDRIEAGRQARKIFKDTIIGRDDLEISV